jgi:hypothetical protein
MAIPFLEIAATGRFEQFDENGALVGEIVLRACRDR